MELMAANSIRQLQAETGHVLCVDDLDKIIKLDRLAKAVKDPLDAENEAILKAPFVIGGKIIQPLTIGKSEYIRSVLVPAFGDEQELFLFAVAWACTMPSRELWTICEAMEIRARVKEFTRHCRWRFDEAQRLFDWLFNDGEGDATDGGKRASYGAIVSLLCREYGSTPDYWLHDADAGTVESLLKDYQRRRDAEEQAAKRTPGRGKSSPSLGLGPSLKGVALHKYNKFFNQLRAEWQTTPQS